MYFCSDILFTLLLTGIPCTETLSIFPSNNQRSRSLINTFTAFRGDFQHGASSDSSTRIYYEPGGDMPQGGSGSTGNGIGGVWSALENTEQWISDTMDRAGPNLYSEKEVSYVCETTDETLMAVASIFRRVKEVRQLAESHSLAEESIVINKGPDYVPSTLQQTKVVIIPWCEYFDSFQEFEGVIQAVNRARESADDYMTDVALEKLETERKEGGPMDRDWEVSVNSLSLHPKYGEESPEKRLEMEKEEKKGKVDLNMKALRERSKLVRQSPYPTLLLEVKALPPNDINENSPTTIHKKSETSDSKRPIDPDASGKGSVSKEDLKKLERLFGQSAATNRLNILEEEIKESNGKVKSIEEVTIASPSTAAQNWLTENDPSYHQEISAFAVTDAKHVDAAYEVIFTNLAIERYSRLSAKKKDATTLSSDKGPSYIIMPHFLSSSATSFENFATKVTTIINTVHGLKEQVSVHIFHPEHVDTEKRCPVPVFVIQWYGDK